MVMGAMRVGAMDIKYCCMGRNTDRQKERGKHRISANVGNAVKIFCRRLIATVLPQRCGAVLRARIIRSRCGGCRYTYVNVRYAVAI